MRGRTALPSVCLLLGAREGHGVDLGIYLLPGAREGHGVDLGSLQQQLAAQQSQHTAMLSQSMSEVSTLVLPYSGIISGWSFFSFLVYCF